MTVAMNGAFPSLRKTLIPQPLLFPSLPQGLLHNNSLCFPFTPSLLRWGCGYSIGKHAEPIETQHGTIAGNIGCNRQDAPPSTLVHADAIVGFNAVFREFGLDEKEAENLIQKQPHLEFASSESLRDLCASLQSVGISGLALGLLVLKRPEILTSEKLIAFLDFIQEIKLEVLEPKKLQRFLINTDFRNLTGFAERVGILLKHGIPQEKLERIVNNVNIEKVFCNRTVTVFEETILFLKRWGGEDLIFRRPVLLNLDLESQLIPRVEFLTELAGGDEKAAGILIGKLPFILAYSVEHYKSHRDFWRSVGLSDEEFFKIALVYPNVISISKERKLVPRVGFLKQCGLSSNDIFKFLVKAPLFLSLSFKGNLSKKLCFLVKIGYKYRTREMALAVGAATRTSSENMQVLIGIFFSYGFSCQDLLDMSRKHPPVLQYNHKSLEKKMEYLIGEMEREVGELLAFPAFLGYKLEDRIKPRYEEKKEIRGKGMSLNKLLSVSTKRFYKNKNPNGQDRQEILLQQEFKL